MGIDPHCRAVLFARALPLALPHGRETKVAGTSCGNPKCWAQAANCSARDELQLDKGSGFVAGRVLEEVANLNEVSYNVHRIPRQTYLRAIEPPPPPPPPSFLSERLMALRLSSRSRRSWSLRKLTRRVYLARVLG